MKEDYFLSLPSFFSLPTLVIPILLLTTVGCPDRSRKDADPIISSVATKPAGTTIVAVPATPAPQPSAVVVAVTPPAADLPDPFADISTALENSTRDTTAGLAAPFTDMNRAINEQIAAWKATGATSTPLMEEKLSLAREDFSQKVSSLSFATEETWKHSKGAAFISLQNLRRVYREYLAGPEKI